MAVLMEDSAAVAGVFLATTSILLTHFTGSVVYNAVGSITIRGVWYACMCVLILYAFGPQDDMNDHLGYIL